MYIKRKSSISTDHADKDEFWTVPEVAAFMRVSCNTVRAKAQSGELPGRKVFGQWKFRASIVRSLMPQ